MTNYISDRQIYLVKKILEHNLIDVGVSCAALIDISGNIVVQRNKASLDGDIDSMAVLAAGNFSAVCAIAERIGEGDFSLLVHKGRKGNIYINKVMDDYLLMTISGKVPSVGVLRLKVNDTIAQIQNIYRGIERGQQEEVKTTETEVAGFSLGGVKKRIERQIILPFHKKVASRIQDYLKKIKSYY